MTKTTVKDFDFEHWDKWDKVVVWSVKGEDLGGNEIWIRCKTNDRGDGVWEYRGRNAGWCQIIGTCDFTIRDCHSKAAIRQKIRRHF